MDVGRIKQLAIDLLNGDEEAATRWLNTPRKALGYQCPINVASTEEGTQEVENLIGRIQHGVFS